MGFPDVGKNIYQIIRQHLFEILPCLDLSESQRSGMQISILCSILLNNLLAHCLKHGIHIVDPAVGDPVNIDLGIDH